MTKEEFYRWKTDGREIFQVVKEIIGKMEYTLAREAGEDPYSDRYKAGMIKGMESVLEIDWEDAEDVEG